MNRWDKPLGRRTDLYIGCSCFGIAAWLLGDRVGMSIGNEFMFALLITVGVGLIWKFLEETNDARKSLDGCVRMVSAKRVTCCGAKLKPSDPGPNGL
jgi:hypothetical protein